MESLYKAYQEKKEIEDRRTALVCAVIANCFRDNKHKAFQIKDFMPTKPEIKPEIKPEDKQQTPEDMIRMLRLWNASVGGKENIK